MKSVFADTCFFFALCHPADDLHDKAKCARSDLAEARIVTSDLVLVELLNLASNRGEGVRSVVSGFIDRMILKTVEIVEFSKANFNQAVTLYNKHNDRQWSLTDCDSIETMRRLGITDALTHDHHFEQAGLKALLRY